MFRRILEMIWNMERRHVSFIFLIIAVLWHHVIDDQHYIEPNRKLFAFSSKAKPVSITQVSACRNSKETWTIQSDKIIDSGNNEYSFQTETNVFKNDADNLRTDDIKAIYGWYNYGWFKYLDHRLTFRNLLYNEKQASLTLEFNTPVERDDYYEAFEAILSNYGSDEAARDKAFVGTAILLDTLYHTHFDEVAKQYYDNLQFVYNSEDKYRAWSIEKWIANAKCLDKPASIFAVSDGTGKLYAQKICKIAEGAESTAPGFEKRYAELRKYHAVHTKAYEYSDIFVAQPINLEPFHYHSGGMLIETMEFLETDAAQFFGSSTYEKNNAARDVGRFLNNAVQVLRKFDENDFGHGDLKPKNALFDDSRFKLIDFETSGTNDEMKAGKESATPQFRAPLQHLFDKEYNLRKQGDDAQLGKIEKLLEDIFASGLSLVRHNDMFGVGNSIANIIEIIFDEPLRKHYEELIKGDNHIFLNKHEEQLKDIRWMNMAYVYSGVDGKKQFMEALRIGKVPNAFINFFSDRALGFFFNWLTEADELQKWGALADAMNWDKFGAAVTKHFYDKGRVFAESDL